MSKECEEFNKSERTKGTIVKVFAVIYLVIAIWTFGHSWKRLDSYYYENKGAAIAGAPFCAAFWPLYWSVVLQENDTKTQKNT